MNPSKDWINVARKRAAAEAVKLVEDSFVVGLGSGSTTAFAIEYIGNRIRQDKVKVLGIPTSYQSYMLAIKHGIQLTNLDEHSSLDLTILTHRVKWGCVQGPHNFKEVKNGNYNGAHHEHRR